MGYFTIEIYPKSHDIMNIVTEFGEFSYNRVLMGPCDFGEISKAKEDDNLGDNEGLKCIPIKYWYS